MTDPLLAVSAAYLALQAVASGYKCFSAYQTSSGVVLAASVISLASVVATMQLMQTHSSVQLTHLSYTLGYTFSSITLYILFEHRLNLLLLGHNRMPFRVTLLSLITINGVVSLASATSFDQSIDPASWNATNKMLDSVALVLEIFLSSAFLALTTFVVRRLLDSISGYTPSLGGYRLILGLDVFRFVVTAVVNAGFLFKINQDTFDARTQAPYIVFFGTVKVVVLCLCLVVPSISFFQRTFSGSGRQISQDILMVENVV
ncbi:hypothetical protein BC830DRAFT_800535 [Chytriomyces sp. MP71]|nr:hypothetical protein BC830DRAFT_800535 [Chytriomyces sp. MP71]